jgi:hypothetical protein
MNISATKTNKSMIKQHTNPSTTTKMKNKQLLQIVQLQREATNTTMK